MFFCDDIKYGREQKHEQVFVPVFPNCLFPIQTCDSYGIVPTIILLLKKNGVNIFLLWILIVLLNGVGDIWKAVTKVRFRQSNWHDGY